MDKDLLYAIMNAVVLVILVIVMFCLIFNM